MSAIVAQRALTGWFVTAVAAGGTVLFAFDDGAGTIGAAFVMLAYFVAVGRRVRWRFGEDAADSLYFLGFLFTVSLLAFSFLRLDGSGKAGLESVLAAVGQGLLLTVWGLLGRQVAILHSGTADHVVPVEPAVLAQPVLQAPLSDERAEPAIRAGTPADDAVREASAAARKLKVVAAQLERAASALSRAGTTIATSTSVLVESVEQSSQHIAGASMQSAKDITAAAQRIRDQLQDGVGEITSSFGAVAGTLDKHGKLLRDATETEANAALASLRKLNALGEESRALATTATQAMRANARLLAEQASAIPDPSFPMAQYAKALTEAARAIKESGSESARAAQTITAGLGDLGKRMRAMSEETGGVMDAAKETLVKTRNHFELFRKLEEEYVALVEEVSRRASKETPRK